MAFAKLNYPDEQLDTGNDSLVIMNYLGGIDGGCTLDAEGFDSPVIKAGHIVIVKNDTLARKPMPVSGDAYDSLPAGYSYEGVTVKTKKVSDPNHGVMTIGIVNTEVSPYPVTQAMKDALKTINFTKN
jgi:hypothetical protein